MGQMPFMYSCFLAQKNPGKGGARNLQKAKLAKREPFFLDDEYLVGKHVKFKLLFQGQLAKWGKSGLRWQQVQDFKLIGW